MTEEEKKMSETSAEAMDAEELGGVSGGLRKRKGKRRRFLMSANAADPAVDNDEDDEESEDGKPEFEPGPAKFIKTDL